MGQRNMGRMDEFAVGNRNTVVRSMCEALVGHKGCAPRCRVSQARCLACGTASGMNCLLDLSPCPYEDTGVSPGHEILAFQTIPKIVSTYVRF